MPDSPSAANGVYKLDNLTVTVTDAAKTLAGLVKNQTKLLNLPSDQIFNPPPSLSGSDSFTIGDTTLGVSSSATYKATALIHPQDADPDGVVTVSSDDAWLKQELDLVVSVSGTEGPLQFGVATVSVGGKAEANVRLLDYRLHSIQDLAGQAVIDAITGARFAARAADVTALDSESRLAFLAGGSLALNVTLSVADVLSTSLSELDGVLGATGTIQIQTGGSCAIAVGLSDDFRLVFSRAASGRIGVDVKKTINSTARLTASYGVTAQFADPQGVATVLSAYITQRLGIVYTDYQKLEKAICEASSFSELPVALQGLAQQAAAALLMTDAGQEYTKLKSKVCGLEKKLTQVIQEVAATRVKAAFTFTWSRTASNATVLSFEIDPGAVPSYLHGLLFGNLTPALKALESSDPRFKLNNYLETRTVTTDRSFGFSLSLGKWSMSSLTDFNNSLRTETTILDGGLQQRIALDSRNSYTGKWVGDTETYFVDFQAAMPGYAASPKVSDFQLGLHLSWTWQESHSDALAARWGDLAELWGCQAGLARTVTATSKDSVEAVVEIVLNHDGVLKIAQAANSKDPLWMKSWGWALATALPPIPALKLRASVQDRERIYLQSAQDLLKKKGQAVEVVAVPQYSAAEQNRLEPIDLAGLGKPLTSDALLFEMYNLRTIWQPADPTGNPSRVFEDIRQTFAPFAGGGSGTAPILGVGQQLRKMVDTDPFNMRLLGAAIARFLQQSDQPALLTASARYTVANSTTTLATASK